MSVTPPSLPPALDEPSLGQLHAALGCPTVADPPRPVASRAPLHTRIAALVRDPRRLRRSVRARLHNAVPPGVHLLRQRIETAATDVTELRAAIRSYEQDNAGLRTEFAAVAVANRSHRADIRELTEINRINLELLKGEVRHYEGVLRELGMAFAPATGLDGAGARFAELREAVNGLERRLRNLSLPGAPASTSTPPALDTGAPRSTLFNYVGFERRFRGDPEQILATLEERYADLLLAHQPIVDIGCGRGELLERLASRGAEAIGVEPDPGMVAEARGRGLTVHEALVGDYLRSMPDASLGSIISTHVAEHLQLDDLVEFLELSVRKLRPGGVFVAETPNPATLVVLGNSYILDPTHVWPLHPSLLTFLAESAGFRDVRLRFFAPAQGYHLALLDTSGLGGETLAVAQGVNAAFTKLNDVLFGPQEYAVVATTAPPA